MSYWLKCLPCKPEKRVQLLRCHVKPDMHYNSIMGRIDRKITRVHYTSCLLEKNKLQVQREIALNLMRKLIEEDGGPLTFICLSVLVYVHTHINIYISTTHVHIQLLSHIESKTIRH